MTASWTRVLVLAAVPAWMGAAARNARADSVVVQFSMTIYQSPFSVGNLAVGRTITGDYSYDPAATSFTGPNLAEYHLLGASLSAGLDTWTTGVIDLFLRHGIFIQLPDETIYNPVDLYEVTGFSLTGPFIEGFRPVSFDLFMVDTDATVYADLSFPVAFPAPSLFEVKQARFTFIGGPGERADVIAQIDSIAVVPEPGSLSLLSLGVLGLLGYVRQRRKRGRSAGVTV